MTMLVIKATEWNTVFTKYNRLEKQLLKIIKKAQKSNDHTVEKLNALVKENRTFGCEIMYMNREMSKILEKLREECSSLSVKETYPKQCDHIKSNFRKGIELPTSVNISEEKIEENLYSEDKTQYASSIDLFANTTDNKTEKLEHKHVLINKKSENVPNEINLSQNSKSNDKSIGPKLKDPNGQSSLVNYYGDVTKEIESKQEQLYKVINWAYQEMKKYETNTEYQCSDKNKQEVELKTSEEFNNNQHKKVKNQELLYHQCHRNLKDKETIQKMEEEESLNDHDQKQEILGQIRFMHQNLEKELSELRNNKHFYSIKSDDTINEFGGLEHVNKEPLEINRLHVIGNLTSKDVDDKNTKVFNEFIKEILSSLKSMYNNLTNEYKYVVGTIDQEYLSAGKGPNFKRKSKKELSENLKSTCDIMKKAIVSITGKLMDNNVEAALKEGNEERKLNEKRESIQEILNQLIAAHENMKNEHEANVKLLEGNNIEVKMNADQIKENDTTETQQSEQEILKELKVTYANMKQVYNSSVQMLKYNNVETKIEETEPNKVEKVLLESMQDLFEPNEKVKKLVYSHKNIEINNLEQTKEVINLKGNTEEVEGVKIEKNAVTLPETCTKHNNLKVESVKTDSNRLDLIDVSKQDILQELRSTYENMKNEYKSIKDKLKEKNLETKVEEEETGLNLETSNKVNEILLKTLNSEKELDKAGSIEELKHSKRVTTEILKQLKSTYESMKIEYKSIAEKLNDKTLQEKIAQEELEAKHLENMKDAKQGMLKQLKFVYQGMQENYNCVNGKFITDVNASSTKESDKNQNCSNQMKSACKMKYEKVDPEKTKNIEILDKAKESNQVLTEFTAKTFKKGSNKNCLKINEPIPMKNLNLMETKQIGSKNQNVPRIVREEKNDNDAERKANKYRIIEIKQSPITRDSNKRASNEPNLTCSSVNSEHCQHLNENQTKVQEESVELQNVAKHLNEDIYFLQHNISEKPNVLNVHLKYENVNRKMHIAPFEENKRDVKYEKEVKMDPYSSKERYELDQGILKAATLVDIHREGAEEDKTENENAEQKIVESEKKNQILVHLSSKYESLKEEYITLIANKRNKLQEKLAKIEEDIIFETNIKGEEKQIDTQAFKQMNPKILKELKFVYNDLKEKYSYSVTKEGDQLETEIALFENDKTKIEKEMEIVDMKIKRFKENGKQNKSEYAEQVVKELESAYEDLKEEYNILIATNQSKLQQTISKFISYRKDMEENINLLETHVKDYKSKDKRKFTVNWKELKKEIVKELQSQYEMLQEEHRHVVIEKKISLQEEINILENDKKRIEQNMNLIEAKMKKSKISDTELLTELKLSYENVKEEYRSHVNKKEKELQDKLDTFEQIRIKTEEELNILDSKIREFNAEKLETTEENVNKNLPKQGNFIHQPVEGDSPQFLDKQPSESQDSFSKIKKTKPDKEDVHKSEMFVKKYKKLEETDKFKLNLLKLTNKNNVQKKKKNLNGKHGKPNEFEKMKKVDTVENKDCHGKKSKLNGTTKLQSSSRDFIKCTDTRKTTIENNELERTKHNHSETEKATLKETSVKTANETIMGAQIKPKLPYIKEEDSESLIPGCALHDTTGKDITTFEKCEYDKSEMQVFHSKNETKKESAENKVQEGLLEKTDPEKVDKTIGGSEIKSTLPVIKEEYSEINPASTFREANREDKIPLEKCAYDASIDRYLYKKDQYTQGITDKMKKEIKLEEVKIKHKRSDIKHEHSKVTVSGRKLPEPNKGKCKYDLIEKHELHQKNCLTSVCQTSFEIKQKNVQKPPDEYDILKELISFEKTLVKERREHNTVKSIHAVEDDTDVLKMKIIEEDSMKANKLKESINTSKIDQKHSTLHGQLAHNEDDFQKYYFEFPDEKYLTGKCGTDFNHKLLTQNDNDIFTYVDAQRAKGKLQEKLRSLLEIENQETKLPDHLDETAYKTGLKQKSVFKCPEDKNIKNILSLNLNSILKEDKSKLLTQDYHETHSYGEAEKIKRKLLDKFGSLVIETEDELKGLKLPTQSVPDHNKLKETFKDNDGILKKAEEQLDRLLNTDLQKHEVENNDIVTKYEEKNLHMVGQNVHTHKFSHTDTVIRNAEEQLRRLNQDLYKDKLERNNGIIIIPEKHLLNECALTEHQELTEICDNDKKNTPILDRTLQTIQQLDLKEILRLHQNMLQQERKEFDKKVKNIGKIKGIVKSKAKEEENEATSDAGKNMLETKYKPRISEENIKGQDSGDKAIDFKQAKLKIVKLPNQNFCVHKCPFNEEYFLQPEENKSEHDTTVTFLDKHKQDTVENLETGQPKALLNELVELEKPVWSNKHNRKTEQDPLNMCDVQAVLKAEKEMLQDLKKELKKKVNSIVKIKNILKTIINRNNHEEKNTHVLNKTSKSCVNEEMECTNDSEYGFSSQKEHPRQPELEHLFPEVAESGNDQKFTGEEVIKTMINLGASHSKVSQKESQKLKMQENIFICHNEAEEKKEQKQITNDHMLRKLLKAETESFWKLKQALLEKIAKIEEIKTILRPKKENSYEEINEGNINIKNSKLQHYENEKIALKQESGDRSVDLNQAKLITVNLPNQNIYQCNHSATEKPSIYSEEVSYNNATKISCLDENTNNTVIHLEVEKINVYDKLLKESNHLGDQILLSHGNPEVVNDKEINRHQKKAAVEKCEEFQELNTLGNYFDQIKNTTSMVKGKNNPERTEEGDDILDATLQLKPEKIEQLEFELQRKKLKQQDPTLFYNVVIAEANTYKVKNILKQETHTSDDLKEEQLNKSQQNDGFFCVNAEAEENIDEGIHELNSNSKSHNLQPNMENKVTILKELGVDLQKNMSHQITFNGSNEKLEEGTKHINSIRKKEIQTKESDEIIKLMEEIRELKLQDQNKTLSDMNKQMILPQNSAQQIKTNYDILTSHIEGDKTGEKYDKSKQIEAPLADTINPIEIQNQNFQEPPSKTREDQFQILKKNFELEVHQRFLEYTLRSLEGEVGKAEMESKLLKKLAKLSYENLKCLEIFDENLKEVIENLTIEEIYQVQENVRELEETVEENSHILKAALEDNKPMVDDNESKNFDKQSYDSRKKENNRPFKTKQLTSDQLINKLKQEISELKLANNNRSKVFKQEELFKEEEKGKYDMLDAESEELKVIDYVITEVEREQMDEKEIKGDLVTADEEIINIEQIKILGTENKQSGISKEVAATLLWEKIQDKLTERFETDCSTIIGSRKLVKE